MGPVGKKQNATSEATPVSVTPTREKNVEWKPAPTQGPSVDGGARGHDQRMADTHCIVLTLF